MASDADLYSESLAELDIPLGVSNGPVQDKREWLANLPPAMSLESLVDYPVSVGDSDGTPISTRIPTQWLEQIDSIRQMPGTHLPDIWPRRSNFVRWCIMEGMKAIARISADLNAEGRMEQALDPIIEARIFVEQKAGVIAARSATMNDARNQVSELSKAVETLMQVDECSEAADMINSWVEGAQQLGNPFWKVYFCKVLIENPEMQTHVATLIADGHVTDGYLHELAASKGLV